MWRLQEQVHSRTLRYCSVDTVRQYVVRPIEWALGYDYEQCSSVRLSRALHGDDVDLLCLQMSCESAQSVCELVEWGPIAPARFRDSLAAQCPYPYVHASSSGLSSSPRAWQVSAEPGAEEKAQEGMGSQRANLRSCHRPRPSVRPAGARARYRYIGWSPCHDDAKQLIKLRTPGIL